MWIALTAVALSAAPAPAVLRLTIEGHRLSPSVLEAPAGQKLQLIVENKDSNAEEIESDALNREKVVGPGKTVTLYLGPLDAGDYDLYGEDHPDSAQATLTVR